MKYFVRTDSDFSLTFNTLREADNCFDSWKDSYMSEGVNMDESFVELRKYEESVEDYIEESKLIKRIVPVIDEQQYKDFGEPKDNGMDFKYWAKWQEESV